MANRHRRKLNWDSIIQGSPAPPDDPLKFGQPRADPSGFTGQTVNGTVHAWGQGWNATFTYEDPQLDLGKGPWQPGRSNRSGE